MEYIFTLKYQLSVQDCDQDAIVERLGAGGCDDALIGIGQPGRIAMEFSRDAGNAKDALFSALQDVKRIVPSACLSEAGPDFVGLSDVAEALGMSRQNLRKLMLHHATSFPAPVHEGSAAVWHLADVLAWLGSKGTYDIPADVLEVAQAAKQINLAKAATMLSAAWQDEVRTVLA